MYPKTEERTQRIQWIETQLQPLYADRDKINNEINILLLEERILQNLEVLDEAEQGNIKLTQKEQQ